MPHNLWKHVLGFQGLRLSGSLEVSSPQIGSYQKVRAD